jgi:hypothetical protein
VHVAAGLVAGRAVQDAALPLLLMLDALPSA